MPSSTFGRKPASLFRLNGVSSVRSSWLSPHGCFYSLGICLLLAGSFAFLVDIHWHLNSRALDRSVGCVKVEDTMRSVIKAGEQYPGWKAGNKHLKEFSRVREEFFAAEFSNSLMRPKVLGMVGIQTGFGSAERRKALRETWLPSDPEGIFKLEQATGLAFRFVIGRTSDSRSMKLLDEEIEKYKDFIRLDIEEEYLQLTKKTLSFFKAAYMLFDADYYIKADDDIYLRPDRLATLLVKDRSSPRTYIGCMKKGPVINDPKMKWYEPLSYLLGNEYFFHAYGPIYILSAEVVAGLSAARNDSFRFFTNEDVTIGSWMLAMNVNHENVKALCDSECTPTSIAVWDIPKCSGLCNAPKQLPELHKLDMCSKSPTSTEK